MHTAESLETQERPIRQGIKTVAIGKKGSKNLSPELIQAIIRELKSGGVSPVEKGAFFGALIMKGIEGDEQLLETVFPPSTLGNPNALIKILCPQSSLFIKECCVKLLDNQTLDLGTSIKVGRFLFSTEPDDAARGLIASILRVRYETEEEYVGILRAMNKTIEPAFKTAIPPGDPIIQIAEPFDGVDHSHLITPLLARDLQTQGFRVVNLVGRNSGPKFGNNLLDLANAIGGERLSGNSQLAQTPKPNFGWYLHQSDLSKAIDRWVEIRHQMIKRPFLATLERFPNPANASIVIASAFHPPYGEKMLRVCEQSERSERSEYKGSIIIRNGIEGTIAFPLKREVRILCSAKKADGSFARNEIIFNPEEYLKIQIPIEEKLSQPSTSTNAELILAYAKEGKTENALFNYRVEVTCFGIKQGIEWIKSERRHS